MPNISSASAPKVNEDPDEGLIADWLSERLARSSTYKSLDELAKHYAPDDPSRLARMVTTRMAEASRLLTH